ncbi:hypothetical protein AMECASPLE_015494, partial [Ameca splendens]
SPGELDRGTQRANVSLLANRHKLFKLDPRVSYMIVCTKLSLQKQTVFQRVPSRDRVEKFSLSEGRTTGPHHRGYSSNVQFNWPGRMTCPTPQLRRLAAS